MAECSVEIIVAGCNGSTLSEEIKGILSSSDYPLFCSSSMLDIVLSQIPDFDRQRWFAVVPINGCFDRIRTNLAQTSVVVLVSGDPLFYGLGKRINEAFPGTGVRYLPAVSYMQSCFSHFGINWDDAEVLSLHGRSIDQLQTRLNDSKLFIFTDPENSPPRIAAYLRERLDQEDLQSMRIMVGERIGSERELFSQGTIDEIASRKYSQPNCMIVLNPNTQPEQKAFAFGLSEDDIHHSRGLITKNEVRSAVIHRLRLPEQGVLWDIGAGSGSISLEAARLFPSLTVFAIEKNPEQLTNIRANRQKYQCRNIRIIDGEAPDALAGSAPPDRVFIGGSGGRIEEIIDYLDGLTDPPSRIVVTAVLERTARQAPEILDRYGYEVDISIVQVERCRYPALKKTVFNPIQIICGRRKT